MEFPDDENGDVLRRIHARGDTLTVPRDIDFSIVFPEEFSAQRFIDAIRPHFDLVRYTQMETSRRLKWDVTATRHMLPSHRDITTTEEFLAAAAEPFGGENDGWGCFNVTE